MSFYLENETKNIITKFNKNDISELEYHFSFKNLEKMMYEKIFNNLNEHKKFYSIEQQVNILYENKINKYSTYRLTKQFKDGINLDNDIIVLKKSINKSLNIKSNIDNILNISLHLNEEQPKTAIPLGSKIQLIIIKLRISFNINQLPDWRYDLDLIKEIQVSDNNLREYKNKILFPIDLDNFISNIPYNHIDKVSLEIEYIGDRKNLTPENINAPIDYLYNIITPNYGNKVNYQNYIYKIATLIIDNKYLLNQFKTKSGFKRLSNNVVELNYNLYFEKVIPEITNYYLTDKIDGQRCMVIIENGNINILSDKLYSIIDKIDDQNFMVFDAEFILKTDKVDNFNLGDIELYIFDVIIYNNENLAYTPFENRFTYFKLVDKYLKDNKLGKVKNFIKLTDNYKKEIKEFYNSSLKQTYETDGLIFTPSSQVVDETKKINNTYINMLGYKWKPENKLTIDFYIAKSMDKNKKDYILCSGINKKDYETLQIDLIKEYYKIIPKKYHNQQYFPIPFTPSSNPLIYKYTHISGDNLTGKIGEFLYNDKKNIWELQKIRTDRDIEVERGEYFGNAFKYAELNWQNIQNPLSINDLVSDKKADYFFTKSDDKYKPQRSFNSFVKSKILEAIVDDNLIDKNNKNWIVDLASGKGQDLARLIDLGFQNGLFIDIDKSALFSLIERKHNLKLRTSNKMNIYIKEVDLSTSFTQIMKKFSDIPLDKADVIICNFAIHYLANNDKNIKNVISLVLKLLKDNGRFIFTCFDGNKIFNLLENSNQWDIKEDGLLKYSIKKEYKSDVLLNHGQKIGVLLPFSNSEYYSEYLVNLDYIYNICEKNGLQLETSNSFETMLNRFSQENKDIFKQMSENDKEFVSLYQYSVLKKTKIKTPNNLLSILKLNDLEIQGKSESNIILPVSFIEKCKNSSSVLFVLPIRENEKNEEEEKLTNIITSIKKNMKKYDIEYKICVVEQLYKNDFNQKQLYNIGFEITNSLKYDFDSVVFIDIDNTIPNDIDENIHQYVKLCDNPILLHKNYVFEKNKFKLINGFSNIEVNNDKIIDRLNYYKIPLITSNINLIISKDMNYDDKFKDNGINSLDYELMENIIQDDKFRFIVEL